MFFKKATEKCVKHLGVKGTAALATAGISATALAIGMYNAKKEKSNTAENNNNHHSQAETTPRGVAYTLGLTKS